MCECIAHRSGNICFKQTVESEAIEARNMVGQSIELIDYDPTWPTCFVEQKMRLTMILNPWLAGEIEHIGSTSVPGLRSKPIVDILAPVQSLVASRAAMPILGEDGWLFWPDDPNQDYRLWFLRPNPTARTHHLQIIQHNHPSFRALIVFRDVLRRDVKARAAYSALKADLANEHQSDRNAYSNAKTEFVQAILEAEGVRPSSRKPV
jgi:GrpB-like predicted nucleotidyltransferase (UPF0157 family)